MSYPYLQELSYDEIPLCVLAYDEGIEDVCSGDGPEELYDSPVPGSPRAVPAQRPSPLHLQEEIGVGSLVEVATDVDQQYYGVVRWIGIIDDTATAGVELEQSVCGLGDGTRGSARLFSCAPGRALFVPLPLCRRDARFRDTPPPDTARSDPDPHLDQPECPLVTGVVPPLSSLGELAGKNRGIQGHHNSCYLDATLFAMFTFTSVFDALLYRPPEPEDSPHYLEVQRVLREEVVNPLRRHGYVRADRVMRLRTLLERLSDVPGLTSEEKDPEEFLNGLVAQLLRAEPFLKLSSGQEAFCYQLFVEKDEQITLQAFRLMNTELRKRSTERNILRSASSIFAADSFELSRDFKNIAIQNFGSEVSRISFDNPNAAAQKINSWIASKTNDQIDRLVSPDSIGVNTQLVLANAIYFKGIWETMFKPSETSLQDFNLSNGSKKSVPFMTLRSGFRAGVDKANKALVIVLPFENNEYSLVMLLPIPGADVSAVLTSLDGETLANYQNLRRQDVLLEIPKFIVRSNANLQPIFAKMGITKMFSPTSELSHIGLYRANSPQVSSAVHSAMMSIDERGATAAASTVVAVVALSFDNPSVVFRADRPFLAVLWDNQLNVPLFMTKIEDPSL